jgi:DNA-binding protein HU-beta
MPKRDKKEVKIAGDAIAGGSASHSKSDFILAVAKKADLDKAEAKRVIELVFGTIEASLKGLKGGGRLPIGNFGVFTVAKRPARMGRNPRTGEMIKIKASKKLQFRPAKSLKHIIGEL